MKSDFFLKVLHEEPLDRVSLEAVKGRLYRVSKQYQKS